MKCVENNNFTLSQDQRERILTGHGMGEEGEEG
jgi:hypothetical protein